jgi:hypoxanthine phosphoribosyltransferase
MSEVATYPGLKTILFGEDEIAERVRELGKKIDAYYPAEDEILVIGLLKGGFMFTADLVRAIGRANLKVDFVMAALYGRGTDASGDVRLLHGTELTVADRHVLVVEDVVDSGKTLNRICDELESGSPRSLEVIALLHKRLCTGLRHEPRWVGFDAPAEWLVGYGLDLGERYRHLPFVGAVTPEDARGR